MTLRINNRSDKNSDRRQISFSGRKSDFFFFPLSSPRMWIYIIKSISVNGDVSCGGNNDGCVFLAMEEEEGRIEMIKECGKRVE